MSVQKINLRCLVWYTCQEPKGCNGNIGATGYAIEWPVTAGWFLRRSPNWTGKGFLVIYGVVGLWSGASRAIEISNCVGPRMTWIYMERISWWGQPSVNYFSTQRFRWSSEWVPRDSDSPSYKRTRDFYFLVRFAFFLKNKRSMVQVSVLEQLHYLRHKHLLGKNTS